MKRAAILLFMGLVPFSQADASVELVRQMAGCFEVTYRYVEDADHSLELKGDLLEWADLSEEPNGAVRLQRVGIFGEDVVKHWSEVWTEVSPGGDWQQTVYGPSGGLRYQCQAPFVFRQWRCYTYGSPKPVRDGKRTDYETLDRENTLQITPDVWIHAQSNIKRDKEGRAVSNELGWNEYRRVDDARCEAARDFLRNPDNN